MLLRCYYIFKDALFWLVLWFLCFLFGRYINIENFLIWRVFDVFNNIIEILFLFLVLDGYLKYFLGLKNNFVWGCSWVLSISLVWMKGLG